jgi:hypothetical protein
MWQGIETQNTPLIKLRFRQATNLDFTLRSNGCTAKMGEVSPLSNPFSPLLPCASRRFRVNQQSQFFVFRRFPAQIMLPL